MDAHTLLGDIVLYSGIIGDGGPRSFRRRRLLMPDRYLPGRFLAGLKPGVRESVVIAANTKTPPAPWFLRLVVSLDEEPRTPLTLPSIDQRRRRRGRWAR